MKYIALLLSLVFFQIGTLTVSQAQDDRYFRSAMVHDTVKAVKKQRVKKKTVIVKRRVVNTTYAHTRSLKLRRTVWSGFRVEVQQAASNTVAILGGRPAGCPHRFCGCALSIKLFGKIIPHLNLAANWLKFPRTAPAPGMVAARRGHVFKLLAHVGGSTWQVWDANSGRGKIRIHNRSIAGYVIVNPVGSG